MTAVKSANLEPIPGYRLVEPLGKGGFGEVWKCEAPGGLFKAVKFVTGSDDSGLHHDDSAAEQELRSFNLIKTIRHPFILSVDRVESIENELVIVMELADRSLHDVFESWRKAGQPGIPRGELLGYLRETAEALDVINLEYGLQHLDVKPRNLFLVHGHIKVADFGLVSSLADVCGGTLNLGAITPLYTAPESFVGKITLFSDQYSLAIAYHELLTGTFPFDGKNFRQLAMQHSRRSRTWSRLSAADRPIVARALAKNPRQRFSSSTEFIEALRAIASPPPPPRISRRIPTLRTPTGEVVPAPGTLPDFSLLSASDTKSERNAPPAHQTAAAPRSDVPVLSPRPTPITGSAGGVVPGYQFLECIGRSPTGEVWRAKTEKGAPRIVKLVAGFNPDISLHEGGPLDRLRALRHPVLEEVKVILTPSQRLALITEPLDTTLADRLVACQRQGRQGIPRGELLGYLAEVAECLDDLGNTERLRHLALTPRALAPTPDQGTLILDFGLAELVWLPGGLQPASLNPRYTAPELMAGQVKPTSDQYSLALIYQEMLTGVHPLKNLSPRQLATQKGCRPDVSLVPAPDRPPLLQALSVDPDRRFSSCTEFIQALIAAVPDVDGPCQLAAPARPAGRLVRFGKSAVLPASASLPQLNKLLSEVVARARGKFEVRSIGDARYLLHMGLKIEHFCHAQLLPTALKVQLHGFRQQWGAQLVASEAHSHVYQVNIGSSRWKRLVGGRTTAPPGEPSASAQSDGATNEQTPVTIEITPIGTLAEEGRRLLEETGPKLLESVRSYLQVQPERRRQERLRYDQSVSVAPMLEDGQAGMTMTAWAVNISSSGMRLLLPFQPPTDDLFIELAAPSAPTDSVVMPAHIVRAEPCGDGMYDVGVSFRMG